MIDVLLLLALAGAITYWLTRKPRDTTYEALRRSMCADTYAEIDGFDELSGARLKSLYVRYSFTTPGPDGVSYQISSYAEIPYQLYDQLKGQAQLKVRYAIAKPELNLPLVCLRRRTRSKTS